MMHENHRDRLRERFLAEGLDGFEPHQALELLLFYAIPRRDTNELAHRLIERFGSIAGVLDAHPSDLEAVDGVGNRSAVLLSLLKPLWRLYRRESAHQGPVLEKCVDACRYAADLFTGCTNEALYLLCLDSLSRLIREVLLGEGILEEVNAQPRAVVEAAIRCNASKVILAHNHPRGAVEPSVADAAYTRSLSLTLSSIGITLADHIIISGENAYSFTRGEIIDYISSISQPLPALPSARNPQA